ncbi:GNAT family N-acetyltransferase [Mycolicibacterium thermoresistibile]|jgi:hypothetical protein|uniref:Acetyltransferase n=2 Tax=Mycolicibacterium thermoresistibile TaxID=1797 RepID=G7CJ23_MYCT3|nr:GNAT family N-acetyltransferase [Mycolicibacterium thermoresistibile]EHI11423.1 acetyltransferase [Mycolicibacterium thermoresistibile ATCC 19527]MCV7190543.1 N-acetyltransferase [Mycolicibacterium thermoresistibile]GAT14093.1 acetyltransferase [Mycolicibacterium thermoresistibile]SNW16263.1 acetyltransferase [Mycolicibacterium thermoresistibile]
MTTDKTGAPTTVAPGDGRFTIAVKNKSVGSADFIDHGDQRVFTHTTVDSAFEGRGLATILIGEALRQTRDAGLRIVPVCQMVQNYVGKHPEYTDVTDAATEEHRRLADS